MPRKGGTVRRYFTQISTYAAFGAVPLIVLLGWILLWQENWNALRGMPKQPAGNLTTSFILLSLLSILVVAAWAIGNAVRTRQDNELKDKARRLRETVQQLSRLHEMGQRITRARTPEAIFHIVTQMLGASGVSAINLQLWFDGDIHSAKMFAEETRTFELNKERVLMVVRGRDPLIEESDGEFVVYLPLISYGGLIGVLVLRTEENPESDIPFLKSVADQLAIAISTAYSQEESTNQAQLTRALLTVSENAQKDEIGGEIVEQAVAKLVKGTGTARATLYERSEAGDLHRRFTISRDLTRWRRLAGTPLDQAQDGLWYIDIQLQKGTDVGFLRCEVEPDVQDAWLKHGLPTMQSAARIFGMAIQNQRLHRELVKQASTDPHTGLWNRYGFEPQLAQQVKESSRYDGKLSILIVDLDGFKDVNDRYGHLVGDQALLLIRDVFLRTLRSGDIPCRWGGDEFILALPRTDKEQALRVAERLITQVRQADLRDEESGERIALSVSIGGASLVGMPYSLDQFLRRADRALYAAKEQGRDRIAWDDETLGLLHLDGELRG